MAISLTVFRAQVDGLLSAADNELSQLRRERLIKAAVERYSRDQPDEVTADITGDAGKYYAVNTTNLPSWVEGFGRIVSIQYPAPTVASDETPIYLEPDDWDDDYWDGSTRYLFLPNHNPAATEALRVRYTAPYDWTASTITEAVARVAHGFTANDWLYKEDKSWIEATDARIATHQVSAVADVDNYTRALLECDPPQQDFFAICHLAGGLCAQAIADKYSRTSDSTISVDSVDHLSRAQQWAQRARELMALYADHLGIGGDGPGTVSQAAGDFVDWDTAPGWPTGRDYLFHGKDTR